MDELAAVPDKFGFAGSFAGLSHGSLLVAGGANFPDGGAPWTGSKKVWTDKIFALDKPTGKWVLAGKLPQSMGYGVSISYDNKLICIGGSNAEGHLATVYAISYVSKKIIIEKWADLPQPLANSCGAVFNHKIYIAGGLLSPDAKSAASIFWSLNLSDPKTCQWQQLESWPGPARMLGVAGSVDKEGFFLFSGTNLEERNGTAHRHYLNDAYKYVPGKGWQRLADMPAATVAAPGPAFELNRNNLLIFGGDDGKLADSTAVLKDQHPGFSDHVLRYDIPANSWIDNIKLKTSKKPDAATNPNGSLWIPVTTTSVTWNNYVVFPCGEVRPAVRTPKLISLNLDQFNLIKF
ncbi:galactose oxidase [Pedobacter sp. HMF7647]|uniref:Galactose oxidase n=1 Tax=Hufsiella arboris TaxID=2695275 RepID=A0A7K1YEP0_9SPHI|nr:galactose oxidase [Hufsiella arboris]